MKATYSQVAGFAQQRLGGLVQASLGKLKSMATWNSKQPFINGCFNWIIPNLYIGNGWKSITVNIPVFYWLFRVPSIGSTFSGTLPKT